MALLKDKKSKPKAGLGIMDLNSVSDQLTVQGQQLVRTQERQDAQETALITTQQASGEARRKANIIRDQAQAESAAIQEQQLQILGGLNEQITKANEAMRLSDSDNPMDKLSLWFLQQSDPSYTREGNIARMQYLQTAAGALGDVSLITQQAAAMQIDGLKSDLADVAAEQDDRVALATLSEMQGQELIDAEVAAQNTRLGIMQTQNSMQANALANMTDDQVVTAVQKASVTPSQMINVGGVDLSLAQLQDRQKAIEERRYNQSVMATNAATLALGNMTQEEVMALQEQAAGSKDRKADLGNGVKVPLGLIQDRLFDLQQRDFTTTQQNLTMTEQRESLLIKAQDKVLGTMEVVELQQIIANGYKDADGMTYSPERVRLARDARAEHDMQIATQNAMTASMTAPAAQGAEAYQLVDQVTANLLPGSPATTRLAATKASIAHATNLLANPSNPADLQTGQMLMQAAREAIDTEITAEALRLADNDKDLAAAYEYQLRGQAIPVDLIEENLQARGKKGVNVGRWLSRGNQSLYTTTFQNTKAALMNPTDGSMRLDTETAEAMAHEEAMKIVMQQIAAPASQEILIGQITQPGHPLRGVMGTSDFASMLRSADEKGFKVYAEASGKTAEELAEIQSGRVGDPALVAAQNAALYQMLETKRPGLGDDYIQWWQSPARSEWVDNYTQVTMDAANGDFSKVSELSLLMPHVQDSMATQANLLVDGRNNTFQQEIANQHAQYITFGNNPQAKQIFLLEQTQGLTTQEKQIAMQGVIQPLLDMAGQNGYKSMEEVSLFVETQLRSYEPDNPQARRVLNKILTGRDMAIKTIDDLIAVNRTVGWDSLGSSAGALDRQNARREVDSSANLPWYQDYLKGGVQTRMNQGME